MFNLRRSTKKQPIEAKLPIQGMPKGELNTSSPTWFFIREWANNELNQARISNDGLNKDTTQTAALRGRIKVLKEILALPVVSVKYTHGKGLIEPVDPDDSTFAGY